MATTGPANHLEQTQRQARQFLDTNNSLTSKISDEMFSLLQAGDGSFYLREQIDGILNDIVRNNTLRGANNPNTTRLIGYDWAKLRQLMSIKDKISYIVAIETTRDNTTRGNPTNVIVPDNIVKEKISTVIEHLEETLLNNQEFTESWILRHAAINRFSCKLDTAERAKLNTFAGKVKKLCSDQGFDILAESAHFTFESDAQKIIKLNEIISQLSAMGVVIPDDILKEFSGNGEKDKDGKSINGFERHIEKLKSLDKAYKHLTSTLHMVHDTAKTTDKSMITPKQKKQLEEVMDKLEIKKTIEDRMVDFNKEENLDKNSEHGIPMELLKTIRGSAKFNEVVSEMGIENNFDHWFLSWITFELTHGAHNLLAKKKSEAFGGDVKKYNEDCNSRRGMMRNRIFEVYDRNAAQRGASSSERDFANDGDYDRMNSYFTKFPNLFFNSPDDNYNNVEGENLNDRNALHFDKMRSILAAILRRRVPALRSSDRIRRGSYPKMIVERARHALKGDERGIFNWIDRQIEHADDASIIAMTIMFQNEANNKLFYEEKDPFEPKSKRYSKIFKKVAGAEKGRQAVRDKFAPATNFALKATETTVKGAVGAAAWTAQKGASMINTPLEGINGWLSKQSNWNPMKLGMIATKPMEWLLNPLSKGIKTGKDGERTKITEALSKGYKAGTEALPVKEGEEKKTKYLYQWLTRGLESITEFFGKTVADSGQWMQDKYVTATQRNVLGALYDAGQKEDRWKDLMASGGLTDVLNLKNIGPKLFDDDGRILPVDKPMEEDKDVKAGKELVNKFEEQLQQLQKGIDDKDDLLSRKLENATTSSDQNELLNKKSQLDSRKGSVLEIRVGLEQIIPALKKPGTTQNQNIIGNIIGTCTPPAQANQTPTYTGLKQNIHNQLNQITMRRNVINHNQTQNLGAQQNPAIPNENIKVDLQWIVRSAESEIERQNTIIANNQGNGNNGQNQANRITAQNNIKREENRIKQAETRIKELNQELIDLSSWESRLRKTLTLITTLRDDQNNFHLDVDTLKSLTNSLDLTFYKPITIQQATQQTSNNLAGALAA